MRPRAAREKAWAQHVIVIPVRTNRSVSILEAAAAVLQLRHASRRRSSADRVERQLGQLSRRPRVPVRRAARRRHAALESRRALTASSWYLPHNQTYRGHGVLVFDPHHVDAARSADEQRVAARTPPTCIVSSHAIVSVCKPDHMNVESLGNVMPHLHWHVDSALQERRTVGPADLGARRQRAARTSPRRRRSCDVARRVARRARGGCRGSVPSTDRLSCAPPMVPPCLSPR